MHLVRHMGRAPYESVAAPVSNNAADLVELNIDCEQSLFGQSRLSSAGLKRANSRERGKRECEAS